MKPTQNFFLAMALLLTMQLSALAESIAWTNPSGGSWSTAENWNLGRLPGPFDTVIITSNGTYTVTLDASVVISGLVLGGGGGQATLANAAHTLTVKSTARVSANGLLELNGGSLAGTGGLTIEGAANWTGATLSPGFAVTVAPGGLLRWNGGTVAGALTNWGAVSWQGGDLQIQNDGTTYLGTLRNEAGALWDIQCDATLSGWSGTEQFHNAGLLRKSAGTGSTWFGVFLDHSGALEAQSGTLQFGGGGLLRGSLVAGAGASLNLGGGSFLATNGCTFGGDGHLRLTGGTLTLAGNVLPNLEVAGGSLALDPSFQGGTIRNLALAGSFTLAATNSLSGSLVLNGVTLAGELTVRSGGVFSGRNVGLTGAVVVEAGGVFDWTGGSLNPGSQLTVRPGGLLNLNGAGLYGALTNQGRVNWQGGQVQVFESTSAGYTGAIWNEAGGWWDIQCDQSLYGWSGTETFHNAGTLVKSDGLGTATLALFFEHSGSVRTKIGTLQLSAGGTLGGSLLADAGTLIYLSGGLFTAGTSDAWGGLGAIRLTGGNLTLVSNRVANLQLTGGTVVVAPSFQGGTITNLSLSGATLEGTNTVSGVLHLNNSLVSGTLTILAGGVLHGTNLTLAGNVGVEDYGVLNWSGGILNGGSTLSVAPEGTLTLSHDIYLDAPLTNAGTIVWRDGTVSVRNNQGAYAGAIWNELGGLWDLRTDTTLSCYWCSGAEVFHNAGLILKSGGLGTASLNVLLDNQGTVMAQSGTLQCNGGLNQEGTFLADSGAALNLNGACAVAPWSFFGGAGAIRFIGGNLTLEDDQSPNLLIMGGTVTLAPLFQGGTITRLTLLGGTLLGTNQVSGQLTLNNGTLSGALTVLDGGVVHATNETISGSMVVEGPGVFTWSGGYLSPGATLVVATNGVLNLDGLTLGGRLENRGTVRWLAGTIYLRNNGGDYAGAIRNEAGALWDIRCDQPMIYEWWSGYGQFHNAGLLRKSAGLGTSSINVLFDNSGAVEAQTGTIQFNGGGSLAGSFRADAGATINLAGYYTGSWPEISGAGTIQFNGASVTLEPSFQGGTITNLTLYGTTLLGSNTVSGTLTLLNGTVSGTLTVLPGAVVNATNQTFGGALVMQGGVVNATASTLAGTVRVGASALLNWSGGYLAPGATLTLAADSTLNLADGITLAGLLSNQGTVNWLSGSLNLRNNSADYTGAIQNEAGGLWDIRCDQPVSYDWWSGYGFFRNAGQLRKTAGAGTTSLNVSFDTSGVVHVQSGTLQFGGGGLLGGSLTADAGATINAAGSYTGSWSSLGGAGTIQFNGGSLALDPAFQGGTITNLTLWGANLTGSNTISGQLTLVNGTLNGVVTVLTGAVVNATNSTLVGTLVVQEAGVWNAFGDYLYPSATFTVAPRATLNLGGNTTLAGVLVNEGTVNWLSGWVNLRNNAGDYTGAISNRAGGLWDIQCDEPMNYDWWSGYAQFHNAGLLRKSGGPATTSVNVSLDNSGAVQAQTGTLQFNGGGYVTGTFTADAGATLTASGSYTAAPWPLFGGEGLVQFQGATVALDPAFAGAPISNLTFSSANLVGPSSVRGKLTLLNGSVSGLLSVGGGGVVNATNATLGGELRVEGGGLFYWAGGYLAPGGTATVTSKGVLGLENLTLAGALTNQGVVRWHAGPLGLQNNGDTYAGMIWNERGAVWDILCDQTISYNSWSGIAQFHNAGLVRKSAETGTTAINIFFDNHAGRVEAQTGTLQFNSGSDLGGICQAQSGAALYFGGGANVLNGTVDFRGPGLVGITGGSLNLNLTSGTLNFFGGSLVGDNTVAGTLNWHGGQVDANASLTVLSNAVLTLAGGAKYLYGPLTNRGTVQWQEGDLYVAYGEPWSYRGEIWNEAGAAWLIQGDPSLAPPCCYLPTFHNTGLLRKTAGTGTTSLALYFDNRGGVVEAQTGTLQFTAGSDLGGTYQAQTGAAVSFSGGTSVLNGPADFRGPGPVAIIGGSLNLNLTAGELNVYGGSLNLNLTAGELNLYGGNFVGDNTIAGTLHWQGGQVDPGASLTILSNGVLNLAGGAKYLYGPLTNQGTVQWQGGDFYVYYGEPWGYRGEIWNEPGAAWDIQSDQTLIQPCCYTPTFHNTGLVRKTAGAGTTRFQAALDSPGAVQAQRGTIVFQSGGRTSGDFVASPEAAIYLAGGYTVGPWPTFGGAGTVQFAGGTLTLDPAFADAAIDQLTLSELTLAGANTVRGRLTLVNCALQGALTVLDGGVLNVFNVALYPGTALTVATNGTLNVGDSLFLGGPLTNQGVVHWLAGSVAVYNDGGSYAGAIWNEPTGLWDLQCEQSLVTGGYSPWSGWVWSPAGSAQFHNAGLVRKPVGVGTATVSAVFDNTGTVEVQTGTLYLNGGHALQPAGTLSFGLSGPADYGRIVLAGGTVLSGGLSATLRDGYAPAPGESYPVLSYDSASGLFDRQIFPPQASWQLNYEATTCWLSVSNTLRLAPIVDRIARVSTLFTLTATAVDSSLPPGPLTFGLDSAPSGMTIAPLTGTISWTPSPAQSPSTNPVVVSVTRTNGVPLRDTTRFVVTVIPNQPNAVPVLPVIATRSVREFTLLRVTNTATESDLHAEVSYELLAAPAGATISPTGVISWSPTEAQGPGSHVLTTVATSTDLADPLQPRLHATNQFTVLVSEGNALPVLPALHPRTINELALLTVTNTALASDLDASLEYRLLDPPVGAQIDAHGLITWTPSQAQSLTTNTLTTVVTSTDLADPVNPHLSATNRFEVVVREVNEVPVLPVLATRHAVELIPLTVTNTALEFDLHATLGYRLLGAPAGARIDANGVITWTPTPAQTPSSNTITTVVTSTNFLDLFAPLVSATNRFTVLVASHLVALEPIADRTVNPGQTLRFTNAASGGEGGWTLTYSLLAGPAGATVDPTTGIFHWRAPVSSAGSSNHVQIRVADNSSPSLTDTQSFTLRVNPLVPAQLTPLACQNGVLTLSVAGTPGPDYILQASDDLARWVNLSTNTPALLPFTLTATNAPTVPFRFYRVLLGP